MNSMYTTSALKLKVNPILFNGNIISKDRRLKSNAEYI
jgi:hypothetical protein